MNDRSLIIVAIVAALGLVGVVTIGVLIMPQEAEALGCKPGLSGFNASQGRCFRG
jgi:hypothetical protein